MWAANELSRVRRRQRGHSFTANGYVGRGARKSSRSLASGGGVCDDGRSSTEPAGDPGRGDGVAPAGFARGIGARAAGPLGDDDRVEPRAVAVWGPVSVMLSLMAGCSCGGGCGGKPRRFVDALLRARLTFATAAAAVAAAATAAVWGRVSGGGHARR
jgi:hypothetical protein